MRILKKEKGWCDFWEIHLAFPWAGKRQRSVDIFDLAEGTEYGFALQTECTFLREPEIYWQFRMSILGFGVGVYRQCSY